MARLRSNFQRGSLSANAGSGDTSISSAEFSALPVVASPDYLMIVLDPDAVHGNPEIVKVTAHTSSATTVTVTRAQESTSARSHNSSTTWRHVPSVVDWAPLSGVIGTNIQDPRYGAKGDGTTDDTAAIQAALNATPPGSICYAPAVAAGLFYKFSTLTIPAGVHFVGDKWWCYQGAAFGNSFWTTTSNYGGSVLKSTATSGDAISYAPSPNYVPVVLQDLLVIGPGSGTSTGIHLGTPSLTVAAAACRNVLVANFATGWNLVFVEESSFGDCRSRGCSTGFHLSDATNQNVFQNTEVQFSSVNAILIGSGTVETSGINIFNGGLIQNCTGTGIHDDGYRSQYGNHFDGFWFENASITKSVWFEYGANTTGGHSLSHCFFGGTEIVKVGAANCEIGPSIWASGSTLTLDATAVNTLYIPGAGVGPTFTDNGVGTITVGRDAPRIVDLDVFMPEGQTNFYGFASGGTLGAIAQTVGGAQNNEMHWHEFIGAGSWSWFLIHYTSPSVGIYSLQIDGSTVATIDGYANPGGPNIVATPQTFTVSTSGVKLITIKMATKNASSSGYDGNLYRSRLQRTA